MKILKYIFVILFFFSASLYSVNIKAQNATIGAGSESTVSEVDVSEDLNTKVLTKINEAKGYLAQADEAYNAGEYDKGYELAMKAKALTDEINQLRVELYNKVMAQNKIEQAQALINEAERKNGAKYAPDELASAKDALLNAKNSLEQKDYTSTTQFADESISYAQACLNKINEQRQAMTGKDMKQNVTDQISVAGEYKIKSTYTVRYVPGNRDCLWRIAGFDFIYKNNWKWPVLFKANKKLIKDPDMIFPGQVLQIPELDKDGRPIMIEKSEIEEKEIITNTSPNENE